MIRFIAAACFFVFALVPPAAAQQNREVAEMQALLADIGVWTQEYQAITTSAGEPMTNIADFVQVLDRFTEGKADADKTRADLAAWRTRSLQLLARARAAAAALRPPPSLAALGPRGLTMEAAFVANREGLPPLLDEFERIINALEELGVSALEGGDGHAARERAVYEASIAVIRVDRGRVETTAASLPRDNPNHGLISATLHYYDTLVAIPELAIQQLDGGGDPQAVAAAMRVSATRMRAELDRAAVLTRATLEQLRASQAGEGVELVRAVIRAIETFPPSIEAYRALAHNIDTAANALQAGVDLNDVMADQETSDAPYLAEIDRLERVRAGMLANNRGAL